MHPLRLKELAGRLPSLRTHDEWSRFRPSLSTGAKKIDARIAFERLRGVMERVEQPLSRDIKWSIPTTLVLRGSVSRRTGETEVIRCDR